MKHPDSSLQSVRVAGTGAYLPERILTNHDLESMVETSDEWIQSRTGMRERRIAGKEEVTSDLAARAASAALDDAGIGAEEVELLITATLSPDMFFPSTACFVQEKIGAVNACCFDLGAACSGSLYALENARAQIASGAVKTALVVGAEKMSAVVDWTDRNTCVLFGDGAGAAVLRAGGTGRGLMQGSFGSDGSLAHLLWMPGGGTRHPITHEMIDQKLHYLKMEGREVFKYAVKRMARSAQEALERNGLVPEQIRLVIPHQANARIIQAVGDRLGMTDRIFLNVEKYANTSAAALLIALHEAAKTGRIERGDLVLLVAFGGGFTWGASVLEW